MRHIYPGATHIHTQYSDGTGNIKDIAAAARKAGLKWIIVTDHNNLTGFKNNEEGWYDGVAVIIGEEISPENSDHYLALGIKEEISPDIGYKNYIEQVNEQGGLGFIAHPDESLTRKNDMRPLRWTDWNVQGFTGLEIWNHLSDLVDNYEPKKALFWYLSRNKLLSGPTPNVLNWWDSLNNKTDKIIPAIGGVDVHCFHYKYKGVGLRIFPYSNSFKAVSNLLYLDKKLSDNFDQAKSQILKALESGNNIIMNRVWNKKDNYPQFYIQSAQKKTYVGEQTKLGQGEKVIIKLNKKAKIRLIHNGTCVMETEGNKLTLDNVKLGKYRAEIFYKNRPWIFTNPILVAN